ncbi:DUF692 domain-containing protein, partial [Aeromonas jandaei]|uniref:DUF692 domain-containing protein n=1 Tax=Aeromonas jandaei TaxID=650 RepID=UPI0021A9A17E
MNPLIGIGLRTPHYDDIRQTLPAVGWLEVHSENYFERHSHGFQVLAELAQHYPVSLHGVGMSLGSADPLDPHHLQQLSTLAAAIKPVRISEHLVSVRNIKKSQLEDYFNNLKEQIIN